MKTEEDFQKFYEERYEGSYMSEWDNKKKDRIKEIIKSLNLPKNGKALDFGCGVGVFTELLIEILPNWEIYACDISENAVNKAESKIKKCSFFVLNSENLKQYSNNFDFLFSHHVLEHVYDIEKSVSEISSLMNSKSYMLHILPCGNEKSFEHNICTKVVSGINKESGRFFYEEDSHLRRLTSEKLDALFFQYKFKNQKSFYFGHYWAAFTWLIEQSWDELNNIFINSNAVNKKAKTELIEYFNKLKIFKKSSDIIKMKNKNIILKIKSIFAKYYINSLSKKADNEWNIKKCDNAASEMYLFYERK